MAREQPEKVNWLDALCEKDLATLIEKGRRVRLPASWSLDWEKTPGDEAFLIVEGEVSVRKGKEEIARLGPGDVIGEMAVAGRGRRSARVVSLTEVEVVHFTSESLTELLDQLPAFGELLRERNTDRLGDPEV